ncbi:keratin-associated protein 14-like [Erinaceus europaeus]|uniref:Keratin-associated protein n=1 Tax=Erinaceus europaeus TaxID=9365 RepID=A0A1S3A378_ERIEU|nr:keratin-associated protein 14-like [Erinaceus europaeus]
MSPVNMSYNCSSGNFSGFFGNNLRYPASTFGSSCLGNQAYSTDFQTPSTCQLISPFSSSCPKNCCESFRCQTSGVVSSPCQISCYRPRPSTLCNPCQTTFSGSLGRGTNGCQFSGCGFTLGLGPSGLQSAGCSSNSFSPLNCRPDFYRPTYFSSSNCQSVSYQPACGSSF